VGSGQSFAGTMEETLSDGTTASRLRSYGSMSYAGFKSLIYAGLNADDPRVVAARAWIERHYTVDENPGVGTDGQYYYYVVFSKSLAALGAKGLTVNGSAVDWRGDLVAKLTSLQEPDGSFRVLDDRWMEDNKVLTAAYGLIALGAAGPAK
jgi:squalene-hopene/tetraprenyl-beta-curcumene cyclase